MAGLCGAQARAQPATQRASLHWVRAEGAESCAGPQAITRQVEDWLGPIFKHASEAQLFVEGLATREGEGFTARITVSRPDGSSVGERRLFVAGSSCAPLLLQAAFVIAVTLDPDLLLPPELAAQLASTDDPGELLRRELEAAPPSVEAIAAPMPPTATEASEPASPPGPAAQAPTEFRRLRRAKVATGVLWKTLPVAAPTLSAEALWVRRWLGFALSLQAALPRRVELAAPGLSGDIQRGYRAWAGRLRTSLCHRPLGRRLWFAGCGALSGSLYGAKGTGFEHNMRAIRLAYNPSLHGSLGLPLRGAWSFELSGELLYQPVRAIFRSISPLGFTATRSSASGAWAGALELGLGRTF